MTRLMLWLCVLALVGCATNPEATARFEQSAAAEMARHPTWYTNGGARVYQVWKDGREVAVIWGSLHINYGSDTMLPRAIRDTFASAADLTTEIPFEALSRDDLNAFDARAKASRETSSERAIAQLDPQTQADLRAIDLPAEASRQLSLRALSGLVLGKASANPLTYTGSTAPVDLLLITYARQRRIPLLGLDTRERFMSAQAGDPNGPNAVRDFKRALRQAADVRAFYPWMLDQYGRGHPETAMASMQALDADADDLAAEDRERMSLLHDRNALWIPKLEATFAKPGLHFVVFGAGHLLGDDGAVALLRARGWQVLPCPGDVCPPT